MSPELLKRSPDLTRLRQEGYAIKVIGGLLLLCDVPYVNEKKQVRRGILIAPLDLAGDATCPPRTHVVHFVGERPCDSAGNPLSIFHQAGPFNLGHGIVANFSFSQKPAEGYPNFYVKMATYATILAGPAATLLPGATPRVFRAPEDDGYDSVFNYVDTASAGAGTGALAERLSAECLAIVGLGGTGAYVLDLVAKTPVREIRLIDGDDFLNHNAFRAPGAPSVDELREAPKKVDYLAKIYSRMHRKVVAHAIDVGSECLDILDGITFAFICIDDCSAKGLIMDCLERNEVPFVDVGMGLELDEGSLGGVLRVTTSMHGWREKARQRIPNDGNEDEELYETNIQVADLNALNAALAVVKWKKLRGFYRDLERERHSTYTTDGNLISNEDRE